MTAAVYRNTSSLSIPPSQNTAPVLEFNCLYTHDVKKKAKKWQDGFLRYHTFNKRVMVYDVPRNLVGDMHWRGDEPIQEGDELTLERNGALVEVGDSVGQVEADLSELRKSTKKVAKSAEHTPARTAPIPAPRMNTAQQRPTALSRSNTQLKHRSLNALLGTAKGPIGKATLPQKSPFEERQEVVDLENEEWEEGRPPKRARVDNATAWSVTRTSKTIKPAKSKESPLWARTADAKKQQKKQLVQPGQRRLGTTEIVELSDDDDTDQQDFLPGFSDAALAPSSPRKEKPKIVQKKAVRSSSPGFQTQGVENDGQKTAIMAENREQMRFQTSRSKQNKTVPDYSDPESDEDEVLAKAQPRAKPKSPSPLLPRPTSSKPGQKLRLAASAPKKKTLLCQDQLKKKPKRISSTNTDDAAESLLNIADSDDEDQSNVKKKKRETYRDRLARIDRKKGSTSSTALLSARKQAPEPIQIPSDHDSSSDLDNDADMAPVRPSTSHETSAMQLRRLDEMMLPTAPPPQLPTSRTLSPEQKSPTPEPPQQPIPARQVERPLRRAASEIQKPITKSKRVPGAPVRFTPTPSPTKSREPTPAANPASRPTIPSVLDPKPQPEQPRHQKSKRPLSKSVSLNVTANGTSTVLLSKPFQAPGKPAEPKEMKPPAPPEPQGPWTREAFDLFVWRPPNWDEEKWCVAAKENTASVGLSGGVDVPYQLPS